MPEAPQVMVNTHRVELVDKPLTAAHHAASGASTASACLHRSDLDGISPGQRQESTDLVTKATISGAPDHMQH